MTWQAVARLDLATYRADGTLRNFGVLFALGGVLVGATAPADPLSMLLGGIGLLAAPTTAVTLAHDILPGRVVSGQVRVPLSLPHTRREYVVGVGAAAFGVAVAITVLAVFLGLLAATAVGTPVDLPQVAGFLAAGVGLTAALVGGSLAVTAGVRSTTLAAALAYGLFAVSFVWPVVLAATDAVLAATVGVTVPGVALDYAVPVSPVYGAVYGLGGVAATSLPMAAARAAGVLSLAAWSVGGTALAAERFDRLEL